MYSAAEKCLKDGLKWAVLRKNGTQEAQFYQELGNVNKFKGDNSIALGLYLKAADIYEARKEWAPLVICNIDIAEFYRKIGKYVYALASIKTAEAICKEYKINDFVTSIRINNRKAAIYNETNMGDSSVFYSRKALAISRKIKDRNSEATSLNELGFSFKNLRKPNLFLKIC